MGEAAFAVIRHYDNVDFAEQPFVVGELGRQKLVRRRLLEIDPQQLLLARNHAELDGGCDRRIAQEQRRDALAFEQSFQCIARLIVADH